MAQLRHPQTGCPWDRKQDFGSLARYTLEEAYEVVDAIERGDPDDLRDELGDLLLQIVFHSRIAEELGLFDFEAVADSIANKMIRRHPHVFDGVSFESEEAYKRFWEEIKREERGQRSPRDSMLGEVPAAAPAMLQAVKIQDRAARSGFDWPAAEPVFAKVEEELAEVLEAWRGGCNVSTTEEIGDLLFVVINLARHLDVDPEDALRVSNRKFRRRFVLMEAALADAGRRMEDCSLEELDRLWEEAKRMQSRALGAD